MTIGGSLLMIAIGAILRYAVTFHVSGLSIQTAGLVLMVVGIVGLVVGLAVLFSARDRPLPPELP